MSRSTNEDFTSDDSGVIQFSDLESVEDSALFDLSSGELRSPDLLNVVSPNFESKVESLDTPERPYIEAAAAPHIPSKSCETTVEAAVYGPSEMVDVQNNLITNPSLGTPDIETKSAPHIPPESNDSKIEAATDAFPEVFDVENNVIKNPDFEATKSIDILPEDLAEELGNLDLQDSMSKTNNSKPKVVKDVIESSTPSKSRSRARSSDQVHESPYNTRLKVKLMKERSRSENTRKGSNN